MDVLKVLTRCHPKFGKVGSYAATAKLVSSHWKASLEQVFLKTERNHWKIPVKEIPGVFQGF